MKPKPQMRMMTILLILCLLPAPAAAAEGFGEIPILMYHHVAQSEGYNTMTVSPQRLAEDMAFLRDNGFTPLLPADLLDILEGRADMPHRPVMITFDDGYESNYTEAFPILKQTGMKATISLIAMLMRTETGGAPWALSWEQCREMYESGIVDFGSHTWNLHNSENRLEYIRGGVNGIERRENEMRGNYSARVGDDLRQSIRVIETNVGNQVHFFAYPFGCADPWMKPVLQEAGIALAVTTGPGMANLDGDRLTLARHRVDMNRALGDMAFMKAMLGEADAPDEGAPQPGTEGEGPRLGLGDLARALEWLAQALWDHALGSVEAT